MCKKKFANFVCNTVYSKVFFYHERPYNNFKVKDFFVSIVIKNKKK